MPSFSSTSVLVVDDSATMRAILRDMLARLGFRTIEEADSGEAALVKMQGRTFALVISDWNMAGMSGLDLLQAFRRLRPPGSSRFIFATSERSYGHQTSAKLDGADAFLIKPFDQAGLRAKIELVLGR